MLLGFGVFLLLLLFIAAVARPLISWTTADKSLGIRFAKRKEIEDFLPFYQSVIGGPMPPMNEVKRTFKVNGEILRFLEHITRGRNTEKKKLVGFCTVLPLKREAVALLEREQLNGLKLTRDHVCSPRETPAAIYIGSIGAKGSEAKAAILHYVLGVIHDQAAHGVRCVYTRPTTKDGLRVAKQYGFSPVAENAGANELGRMYKIVNRGHYKKGRAVQQVVSPNNAVAASDNANPTAGVPTQPAQPA